MRLALLWALGLLGAGSPRPSPPLPNIGGTEEEQQASPERTQSRSLENQVVQDSPPINLTEVLQTGLPETLRIGLELDGENHILELQQNRDLVPGRPTLVWYQPDGTRMVSEGHSLENCCYRGRVQGRSSSWVSLCACSGIRGLVVLSPERSYTLELGPGDLQRPLIASRIQDLLLPGHTCAPSWHAFAPTEAAPDLLLEQHHLRRLKRDVVTETKIVELVIVADNSEVRKYPDFQQLLNRTLEVALLLDTFFQPLNVRVALVGLEAWTQRDLIEMSSNPAVLLDNFLRWRRTDLLPRLPHDSAQLVTVTSFSGPMVGMAIQNSICSPDFSGGVNMVSDLQVSSFPVTPFHCLGAFIHRTLSSNLSKLRAFSPGQRSGPGSAGPDQTGPQGRCGCCPCCGLCSGPRCSARACGGAPASATLSTGTPLTPGCFEEMPWWSWASTIT